nr:hypothetical protein [Kribbella sandramycini]
MYGPPTSRGALVVTDATKKLREPVAYILLAFAGLFVLAALIRLFVGGAGFTASAGSVQGTLTPPGIPALVLLTALVASVWLVNESGERTQNARTVTLAALAITGVAALLGLITAFAGFAETSTAGLKVVAFVWALGGLALYGAAGLYVFKTFQGLPAPVRAPKPGQFAQQGQYGNQYGQQQPQFGGQQGYGQQQGQYGQQGQYDQGQAQGGQYGGYGAAAGAGAVAGAAGGYAAAQQGGEQQWPQEQGWNQGEQQQAWSASDAEAQPQQPAEQAWSAGGQNAEPTQQWSSEGQQQWSGQEQQAAQWPQEQQQWSSGQDYPQSEWPSQGEQAQPEAPQAWQGEQQSWPVEDAPAADAPAAEQPKAEAAPDETRVDPRVSEGDKDDQNQQQGQGQQGWWSQPS